MTSILKISILINQVTYFKNTTVHIIKARVNFSKHNNHRYPNLKLVIM